MKGYARLRLIFMILVFFVSLWLVFYGRAKPGYTGLALEVLGMIGLIAELYVYNKQYR